MASGSAAVKNLGPAPQIGSNAPGTNPAAYDELKKRLLNEYKKLVNNKTKFESDVRERDH